MMCDKTTSKLAERMTYLINQLHEAHNDLEDRWYQKRKELRQQGMAAAEELGKLYNELAAAAKPFADERRIVAPSADPNTDPAVVVSLAELERLRRALAAGRGEDDG